MTEMVISERLRAIAGFCQKGKKVADIGSDHALLASYLLTKQISPYVVAGELNEGPYQAAKQQLAAWEERKAASVRRGDGLAVIEAGEVDIICIAGMGGQLITSILDRGKDKLPGVNRLILQPNVGVDQVRNWFVANGWQLVAEQILEEDGIIYEVLVAEPGDPYLPYQGQERPMAELLRLGPHLWRERSPILQKKWQRERDKLANMLQQLAQAKRPDAHQRIEQVKQELEWIDGVISCWHMDKQ